jgi:hypothetical protein
LVLLLVLLLLLLLLVMMGVMGTPRRAALSPLRRPQPRHALGAGARAKGPSWRGHGASRCGHHTGEGKRQRRCCTCLGWRGCHETRLWRRVSRRTGLVPSWLRLPQLLLLLLLLLLCTRSLARRLRIGAHR